MGKTPQHCRAWSKKYGPEQYDAEAHSDGTFTLGAVRNFTYTRTGEAHEAWLPEVHVRPDDVVRTWYLLEPFTRSTAIAHPYFIFEYRDGTTLCVSIEGKRLNEEPYSGYKGLTNAYELGLIWMTEGDCLTMPLTHGAKALYLYPLKLTSEESARVMRGFLSETHRLRTTPEFYHAVFNNCTVRFAQILRRETTRRVPFDLSWYLPGWSDRYLARLGLIDASHGLRTPARDLVARSDEVWMYIEKEPGQAMSEILKQFSNEWAIQDSNL